LEGKIGGIAHLLRRNLGRTMSIRGSV
jgi:hypothetical protein